MVLQVEGLRVHLEEVLLFGSEGGGVYSILEGLTNLIDLRFEGQSILIGLDKVLSEEGFKVPYLCVC